MLKKDHELRQKQDYVAQRAAIELIQKCTKKNEYEIKMRRHDSAKKLYARNVSSAREGSSRSRIKIIEYG